MTIAINGSGTITGISVGGLNDNIITKNEMATGGAWAPAGTVLQVVYNSLALSASSTSSSFADTGLSASITPTSSTSKILVLINHWASSDSSNANAGFQLLRGASVISDYMDSSLGYSSTFLYQLSAHFNYLDSPATTSFTTYKTQFRRSGGSSAIYLGLNNPVSSMTLIEVAA